MESYRLLHVDDETQDRQSTAAYLKHHGFEVEQAATSAEALAHIEASADAPFAAIIVDYNLRNDPLSGAALTRAIREKDPHAFIIVYSSDVTQEATAKSWDAGAIKWVKKEPGDHLLDCVREQCVKFDETRATLRPSQVSSANTPLISKIHMVGRSNNLAQGAELVLRYRSSRESVLILGESGVGKEGFARALGDPTKPFIAVNCAQFAKDDLLEGELFGYEKGAFTGATSQKQGLLQIAGHGTVFLDEVHEMSKASQAKLLRALQERTFRRMNGFDDIQIRCRLIFASKPDLPELAETKIFKPDLFHRISKLVILVAPLRERRDDIAPLILHFTKTYKEREGLDRVFRKRTVRLMEQYDWPGNVRELDNVVYQLMKNSPGRFIDSDQLPPKFFKNANAQMTLEQFREKQYQERKEFILKVCESSANKAHAAKQLGILPHAIHALLKTHEIVWEKKNLGADSEKVVLQ